MFGDKKALAFVVEATLLAATDTRDGLPPIEER